MRVAMLIGSLHVGGAETQVVGIARGLRERGHDVDIVLMNGRGPLLDVARTAGIGVHLLDYPGIRFRNERRQVRPWLIVTDALRLLSLFVVLRRGRYDVLHAFLFHSYVLGLPLGWLARVPVRIAARRGLHSGLPRTALVMPLTRLSTRLATAVVANADAVAEDAHRHEHVPRSKLVVVRNAVDLPQQQADPSVQPATGLIIANLIHYKGHLDLAEAVRRIQRPPRIRCIGEGPMRAQVEAAILAGGIQDSLLLEGSRAGARSAYLDVQFAVLASHSEGMPNAILEAMAAGLPVVATDVGGVRELVENGVTGLLVPASDPDAMAAALQRIADDVDFRVAAGAIARERAASFSWAAAAAAHEELYLRLLRGDGARVA